MKKHLFTAAMALVMGTGFAQSFLDHTTYRGAFEPAPTAQWTAGWTNWDPQNTVYPAPTMTVSSNITTATTWATGQTVLLQGPVFVTNGAVLTIQPGVIVRGSSAVAGSGLFVCTGAKLNAVGNATAPIVFTSDNAPGNRIIGDWGGIILMGLASCNAPASNTANVTGGAPVPAAGTNYIEGIASSSLTLYGGGSNPNDHDNSGDLEYVRIEFGGYVYAPNKEINGLTFGAVGDGTKIDHIQCSFINDDAYEWFGGSVNCKHIIAYGCIDDDWDTDNGFHGKVQYGLGIRHPKYADPTYNVSGGSTSEGFESDNNPADDYTSPQTAAIFANMTEIGPDQFAAVSTGLSVTPSRTVVTAAGQTVVVHAGFERGARIRRNSALRVINSLVLDHATNGLYVDGNHSEDNANGGCLLFKNNILAGYGVNATTRGTYTVWVNQTAWMGAQGTDTSKASVTVSGGNVTSLYMANPYFNMSSLSTANPDFRPIGIAASGADWAHPYIAAENTSTCTNGAVTVGIKENNILIGSVNLFPNPSTGLTSLQVNAHNASSVSIHVCDITGKVVMTPVQNQTMVAGENTFSFNAQNLNDGIYFVTLTTDNGKETVKLVVSK